MTVSAPPTSDPQSGYGKLAGGGGGMGVGLAAALLLAKLVNAKWPGALAADDGSLIAFTSLVSAAPTLLGIYLVPHNAIGGK